MISHEKIDELVREWASVDPNPDSRLEILSLQKDQKYDVLRKKLYPRIAFGTAGLRSSMESGFAHMNDVTILQASQGLVEHIVSHGGSSIVIGYDHRHHSQRFAEITASVALFRGLRVFYLGSASNLSDESLGSSEAGKSGKVDRSYVHTPMVPFGIDFYKASAGVMVTASHNPAKDNGYKVYYGNGCQIIPPQDKEIAQCIDENLQPWSDQVWRVQENIEAGMKAGKLVLVKKELSAHYVEQVAKELVREKTISYKFVYTPMHGVGLEIFRQVCNIFNAECETVPEQEHPDPDFPTVRFPNPEEAGALDLAIEHAKKVGAKLVVASDPDADRFSVAVEKNGKWRQLTGNEIGILFSVYVVEELTPETQLAKTVLLNSTVSSQLLRSLAEKAGCLFQDTLTGFKWIGNKALDLKAQGYFVPFGYEEAIGYMFPLVNDKDGISAAAMWLQLYEKWFSSGKTDAIDKLEQIYARYGYFKECNGYYKVDDVEKTSYIFDKIIRSSYGTDRHYPEFLGDFKVAEWRDLTIGYESSTKDNVPLLPTDPSSQMITGVLEKASSGKVRFTCRGSGTEPKLKVYIEGTSERSEEEAQTLAKECWTTLRELWFRPKDNGLLEVV
ncbi:putative phosphoribomutase [Clavispora lusitaniae]|uniref:Phosphoribomutase n=1 Tax=Clavispora lusitaniae TaxID=36911 RepID=A0AA91PZ26_CLALS|nr:putative phosphoribomutase [Clavispora lusitaniae]